MSRRSLPMAMVGAALLLVAAAPTPEPAFSPVQPELLGMAGSLSNAWADFDNDGDLDLALDNDPAIPSNSGWTGEKAGSRVGAAATSRSAAPAMAIGKVRRDMVGLLSKA